MGDTSPDDLRALTDQIAERARPEDLPALFGFLAEDLVPDVNMSILLAMEGMDEPYIEALARSLADLDEQAPTWALTAVLRVANTRGTDDDCTPKFIEALREAPSENRSALGRMATRLDRDPEADALTMQRRNLRAVLRAVIR